jgi:DNA processing protein
MQHLYEALLLTAAGIGKARLAKLKQAFGDAKAVWQADLSSLTQTGILSDKELASLMQQRRKLVAEETFAVWQAQGIGICSLQDVEYPQLLRRCYDPPPYLFYRGRMQPEAVCLAIVGSRHSTPYGRNVARSFSESLSRNGVTVVSGAARGIDSAAHEGALTAGAPTIAVLGCGVDVCYPPENARLINQIAEIGCVISEYPPGTPPAPGRFPARNRIVAGMSVGVLVVEAAEKSGALITADLAMEENRDVYAIPGSVFSEASRGTHRLIQQGARLINSAEDLLAELGLHQSSASVSMTDRQTAEESQILAVLSYEQPKALEQILGTLDISVSAVQLQLLQLEMSGKIEKDQSMRYIKVARE